MSEFWSGWVILLIVFTLGAYAVPVLCGDCGSTSRRSPTARADTCGRTACCAKACGRLPTWWIVISAIGIRRGLRLPCAVSGLRCVQGQFSAGRRTTSSRATRPRTVSSRRRCASASAARSVESIATDPEALRVGADAVRRELRGMPRPRRARQRRARRSRSHRQRLALWRRRQVDPDQHPGRTPRRDAGVRGHYFRRFDPRSRPLRREPRRGSRTTPCARSSASRFSPHCAPCHGADGKGNPALGAPNLTDGVWLYGGMPRDIAETIRQRPQRRDAGVARPPGRRGRVRSSPPGSTRNRTRRPSRAMT